MVLIFLIFSHGFNKWRDPIKPTAILQRLCKDYKLDGPHFSDGKCRIEGKMFHARDHIVDDNGKRDFQKQSYNNLKSKGRFLILK